MLKEADSIFSPPYHLVYHLSTSWFVSFYVSSFLKSFRLVKLSGDLLNLALFKSIQKGFFGGFGSGLWLGFSKMFFLWSYSLVDFDLCLRLLSCWKMKTLFIFKFLMEDFHLLFSINFWQMICLSFSFFFSFLNVIVVSHCLPFFMMACMIFIGT